MAKSVSVLLVKARGYFLDVNILEAGGQAAVIAACTDQERTRRTLGVQQVGESLEESINMAIAKSVAAFDGEEMAGADPEGAGDVMVVPEDVLEIPGMAYEDIQDMEEPDAPVIESIPEPVVLSAEEAVEGPMPEQPVTESAASADAVSAVDLAEDTHAPAEVTDGEASCIAAEPKDFEFAIGPHLASPMMASEMVRRIKAGDAKELKTLGSLKTAADFMKTRGGNEKVRNQIERFLQFAGYCGVA